MASISNAINMSFRVDKDLKKQADELFKNLGMNTSVALNMFLAQCVRDQSLPFQPTMEKPSKKLLKALKEVEKIKQHPEKYKSYHNIDDMFEDILNEDTAN